MFVGRDTRASGVELEDALARGIASAGGNAVLAGVLPTPAVALLSLDIGAVITASHNPPEYNGVKFFDAHGQKLTDAGEEKIEALLDAEAPGGGTVDRVEIAPDSYLQHIVDRFGSDLTGLRIGVDCANGAYTEIAPRAFKHLGADVTAIGVEPDGTNINKDCGATDLRALQRTVVENALDLGVAFDGDGDRMLAVDGGGEIVDGDRILAVLAPHLGVDLVAVTVMSNLGLHQLLEERRHPRRRRPTSATGTCSRRCASTAGSSAASSPVTSSISAITSPATVSPPRSSSATRSAAARSPRRRPRCRHSRR